MKPESNQIDKIYVFLSSALGYNTNTAKKYFFDRKNKVFFNLKFDGKTYTHWEKTPHTISAHAKTEIQEKIKQIEVLNENIFEIKKLDKSFDLFPVPKNEESEEFKKRAEVWRALFDEVDLFLKTEKINIEETRLIEYQ